MRKGRMPFATMIPLTNAVPSRQVAQMGQVNQMLSDRGQTNHWWLLLVSVATSAARRQEA